MLAAAIFASAGGAAPPPGKVAVSYADLDLRTPNGVAALNKRLRRAALRLCDNQSVRPLPEFLERRRCMDETVRAVAPQVEQALAADSHALLAAREFRPAEAR